VLEARVVDLPEARVDPAEVTMPAPEVEAETAVEDHPTQALRQATVEALPQLLLEAAAAAPGRATARRGRSLRLLWFCCDHDGGLIEETGTHSAQGLDAEGRGDLRHSLQAQVARRASCPRGRSSTG